MNPSHAFLRIYEALGSAADIADPGDAGTIRVDRTLGFCRIKSAAAETRTVAAPDRSGVITTVLLGTDGGDVTVTVTGGYDQAGTTTFVLDDVGDFAVLESIETAADTFEWRVIASSGGNAGYLNLPIGAFAEQDGTALVDFVNGASATPGWSAGDEGFGIRWNNHANPDPVSMSVPIPPDFSDDSDATLHIIAAKVGATLADAVTWTVEAFNAVDGALYDADTDFGGASSAMTGDAATKTVQHETLTLAAADLAEHPGVLTLTIQPTDGTLGTDDVILLGVFIQYAKKAII